MKPLFKLVPLKSNYPTIFFSEKVKTIGRSESCDYSFENEFLSFMHSSISLNEDKVILNDLESTNGTFVNDEKISSKYLEIGDLVRFGSIRYRLKSFSSGIQAADHIGKAHNILANDNVVHALETSDDLSEISGPFSIPLPEEVESFRENTGIINVEGLREQEDYSDNPLLNIFPEFEYSEFLFEENLKVKEKAFEKRKKESFSLEITSIFGSLVFRVDYWNKKNKILELTNKKDESRLSLPFENISEGLKIAEHNNDGFFILPNDYFETKVYKKNGDVESLDIDYLLKADDLVVFSKGINYLYIRLADSPPKTIIASFFEKDKVFSLIISLFFLFWCFLSASLYFYPVEPIEPNKEKIIKRIDRILYKKKEKLKEPVVKENLSKVKELDNLILDKKKKKNKPAKKKSIIKEESISKVSDSSTIKKESDKSQVLKANKKIKISKNAKNVSDKIVAKKSIEEKFSKYLNVLDNTNVKVEKSNLNLKNKKIVTNSKSKTSLKTISVNGSNLSQVVDGIGELGSEDIETGSPNVIGFKNTGLTKTVVLGALDPKVINNILKKHLPRFAFCYERELERTGQRISAVTYLKFKIMKTGKVSDYSFTSNSLRFSSKALSCFSKVLTSIKFPRPRGGGFVKVNQPINMEPKF